MLKKQKARGSFVKKRMKKMLALGLAVAMTCGVSTTALAAEPTVAQTETVETDTQAVGQADATDVDEAETVTDTGEAVQASEETQDAAEQESVTADVQDVAEEASETEAGTVEAGEEASVVAQAPQALNGLAMGEDGIWYAFRNGIIDSNVDETLMPYGGGWWYVSGGMIDFDYEGLCEYGGVEWYIKSGQVQFGYSGFVYVVEGYDYQGLPYYNWEYIHDGKIDETYTDVVWASRGEDAGWYNIKNGRLGYSETLAQNVNGWWYIGENSKVDFSYTGVEWNEYGGWYVKNGQIDFGYTGIWENTYIVDDEGHTATNQVYIRNGQADKNMTGVYWTIAGGQYGWHGYYEGELVRGTGEGMILPNENGWWYVDTWGNVDFSYTGVGYNDNGYWYVRNGQVDFSYNGFYTGLCRGHGMGGNGTIKIVNGKVDENYTGVFWLELNGKQNYYGFYEGWLQPEYVLPNENGWWYVNTEGIVDFSYNGSWYNENGKWKITNGAVDFGFTGTLKDKYGDIHGDTYSYFENGRWCEEKNDVVYTSVDGEYAWWHVSDGRISKTGETVACNSNGWWYIKDGKVDFGYTGLASNENGTWYIKNGQVDFNYTGVLPTEYYTGYYYIVNGKMDNNYSDVVLVDIKGSTEWRVVDRGYVDFHSENDIASNANGTWYCVDGKVDFSANGTKVIKKTIFSWSGGYTVTFCYVLQVSGGYVTDVRVVSPEKAF